MVNLIHLDTSQTSNIVTSEAIVSKINNNPFECSIQFGDLYRDVRTVELASAEIPQGFYNIRSPLNTFIVNGTTYTVPEGNYAIDTLLTSMGTATSSLYSFATQSGKIVCTGTIGTASLYSNIAGSGNDTGKSITVDNFGNIIVTGNYVSSSTVKIYNLGTQIDSGYTLPPTNGGGSDMFVIKYGPDGTVLMFTVLAGAGVDIGNSVTTDASSNIIVTGSYTDTTGTLAVNHMRLSSHPVASTYTLPSTYSIVVPNMFVIKYGPDGTVLMFTTFSSNVSSVPIQSNGYSVKTDASSNVIVTGNYASASGAFATTAVNHMRLSAPPSTPPYTLPFSSGNTSDIFIIKYGPDGTVLLFTALGGSGFDSGISVATDASSNVIVTGNYLTAITINQMRLSSSMVSSTYSLPATGSTYLAMFIIKYGPNGDLLLFTNLGITLSNQSGNYIGNSVATDSSSNVIVTGYYQAAASTTAVNHMRLNSTAQSSGYTLQVTGGNSSDLYIIKYGPNGDLLMFTSQQGTVADSGNSVSTDSSGNIILGGTFTTSTTAFVNQMRLLNAPVASTYKFQTVTGQGAFVVVYKPNGDVLMYTNFKASGATNVYGVTVDSVGNILIIGSYTSPSGTGVINNLGSSTTGTLQASAYTLPLTATGPDIFIIKYTTSPPLTVTRPSLLSLLGFDGSSSTSTNQYIFPFDDYINIWIENVGPSSQEPQTITYKVPISSGTTYWTNNNVNKQIVKNRNYDFAFSKLNILVFDRFGNKLNNNGLDWSFSIKI